MSQIEYYYATTCSQKNGATCSQKMALLVLCGVVLEKAAKTSRVCIYQWLCSTMMII